MCLLVLEMSQDMMISLSHEVIPHIGEYERTNTAAINAYVMPETRIYLEKLMNGLGKMGFSEDIYIMKSNGGITTVDNMIHFPVHMIEAGPAAGAALGAGFRKPFELGRSGLAALTDRAAAGRQGHLPPRRRPARPGRSTSRTAPARARFALPAAAGRSASTRPLGSRGTSRSPPITSSYRERGSSFSPATASQSTRRA